MGNVHKLPGLLKLYSESDYVTRQKAKFLFYLCITLIASALLLISLRLYFHPLRNTQDPSHLTNLLPLALIFLSLIISLFLLIRGYYKASSIILPFTMLGVIWTIMFIEESEIMPRLNTIVYVYMVLSMLPLLIQKRNIIILLTTALNIIAVIGFSIYLNNKLNLSDVNLREYIIDNSISFAVVGFLGFYMNKIYTNAIEQAQTNLQKRIETEKSLIESESKYREITESLPQIVFDIDLNGRVKYINQIGLTKFGYSPDYMAENLFIADFIVEKEMLLQNIDKILDGKIKTFTYTAIQKDKTTFPLQVYSIAIQKDGKPIGFRGIAIDLTEEIKNKKIIQESEERFSAAFKSNPAPMAISEIESGLFIDINDKWAQLIGYSRDEHIGRTSQDLNYWFDNDDRLRIIKKTKENGFVKDEIARVKTKSGAPLTVKWSAETITLNGKKVILSLASDETEKLKAEAALRESEERFSVSFKSSPAPLIISKIETGEIIDTNDKWVKMLGYTYSEQIGKTTKELGIFANSDDRDKQIDKLKKNGFIKDEELNFITKSGELIIAKWSAEMITLKGEKVLLSLITDETAKIKAEEEIRQSSELFKTLIESSPISITLSDLQGKIIVANHVFSNYADQPLDNIIGKTYKEIGIITDTNDEKIVLEQFKRNGYIKNFETTVINQKGKKIFMLFSAQVVTFNGQKGILQTSIDISDRKYLEEELKKHNEQLEFLVKERTKELEESNEAIKASNNQLYAQHEYLSSTLEKLKETQEQLIQTEKMASLGVLTAGVAHEINNPINYIYNGSLAIENYLADHSPETIETLKPLFEAINTGIKRVTEIVRSLNKYSRKDESFLTRCNINDILDNALTMLFYQYKKRIEIIKDYSSIPPMVIAKEGELHQVFINILTNAIQSIKDTGTIEIRTKVTDNTTVISVKDSGVGIRPENIKKVFDPFFSTKDPGKGTGLGLSITKRIIVEHKGTINCYSEPDKGSEFVITLPQTQEG